MRLLEIIDFLKKEVTPKLDQLSDNCILENAIKIYLSEQIQEYKMQNIRKIENQNQATDKQIAYLISLGYKGDINLSKEDARKIINILKEQR